MSDVFRATFSAANSAHHAHTQRLGSTAVDNDRSNNELEKLMDLEKLMRLFMDKVQQGTLSLGTMGVNGLET